LDRVYECCTSQGDYYASEPVPSVAPPEPVQPVAPSAPNAEFTPGESTQPKGGVYTLTNKNGDVMRVGYTKNFDMRANSYSSLANRDPRYKNLEFNRVFQTDNYAEQRWLEQYLFDANPHPLNVNRPISPRNGNIET
jgi:hypothetical protein